MPPSALTPSILSTIPSPGTPTEYLDSTSTRTFSCAFCERILADSSHLLFQNHQRTLTFTHIICTVSPERKTSYSDWDENSTYCAIHCSKCSTPLGRTYLGTPAELVHLQGRFTVDIENLAVYTHGDTEPAAKVVENPDVARLLNPDQDEVVEAICKLQGICVALSEGIGEIAKSVERIADVVGVRIEATGGELAEDGRGEGLLERVTRLEELRMKIGEGGVAGDGMEEIARRVEQLRTKLEERMADDEVEEIARSVEHLRAKLDGLAQLEAKVNHIDTLETKLSNLETDLHLLSPRADSTVIVSIPESISSPNPPTPMLPCDNNKCHKRKLGDSEPLTHDPPQKRTSPPETQRSVVPNSQSTEGEGPEDPDNYAQRRKSNLQKKPRPDPNDHEFIPESDEEEDIRPRRRHTGITKGQNFGVVVAGGAAGRVTRRKSGGR